MNEPIKPSDGPRLKRLKLAWNALRPDDQIREQSIWSPLWLRAILRDHTEAMDEIIADRERREIGI